MTPCNTFDHAQDSSATSEQVRAAWPLIRERVRMPRDVFAEQAYLFADPQEYDPKGVEKHLADPAILSHLQSYTTALASAEFEAAALEANLRECADAASIKARQLIHPIRLGLTGRTVSPSSFPT